MRGANCAVNPWNQARVLKGHRPCRSYRRPDLEEPFPEKVFGTEPAKFAGANPNTHRCGLNSHHSRPGQWLDADNGAKTEDRKRSKRFSARVGIC